MASTLALAYELWGQVHETEYVSVDKVWGVVVLMGDVEFSLTPPPLTHQRYLVEAVPRVQLECSLCFPGLGEWVAGVCSKQLWHMEVSAEGHG